MPAGAPEDCIHRHELFDNGSCRDACRGTSSIECAKSLKVPNPEGPDFLLKEFGQSLVPKSRIDMFFL